VLCRTPVQTPSDRYALLWYPLMCGVLSLITNVSYGNDQILSQRQACSALKRVAITQHLSVRNLSGRYYCDSIGDDKQFYLMGLRYRTTKGEMVGSNLIGWFAIRRSDGVILDWDRNEGKASPLAPRPPFQK
jgi:hypothetical protein